jgi:hypothetical protein
VCDYSLRGFPSRLAREGETVIARSLGATICFVEKSKPVQTGRLQKWTEKLLPLFLRLKPPPPLVVCIPPGATLHLANIPCSIQTTYGVGSEDDVTMVHLTEEVNVHRDGIRFSNGEVMSLQELSCGERARIVSLSGTETEEYIPHSESEEMSVEVDFQRI